MKLTKQSHEILFISPNTLQIIEMAARTCYKSEDKITDISAEKLVRKLLSSGHEAMIEFADMTVKFITNRGVTHELVRHRLCAFAQESTRYVRYNDVEFIEPVWGISDAFLASCEKAGEDYRMALLSGESPQQAREVLPNALKTEIVVKANMREWRHIFKLRCSPAAHPQIRDLMLKLLDEVKTKVPVIFESI